MTKIAIFITGCAKTENSVNQVIEKFYANYPELVELKVMNATGYSDGMFIVMFLGHLSNESMVSVDLDGIIRMTHHGEALYEDTETENIHIEVGINDEWYGLACKGGKVPEFKNVDTNKFVLPEKYKIKNKDENSYERAVLPTRVQINNITEGLCPVCGKPSLTPFCVKRDDDGTPNSYSVCCNNSECGWIIPTSFVVSDSSEVGEIFEEWLEVYKYFGSPVEFLTQDPSNVFGWEEILAQPKEETENYRKHKTILSDLSICDLIKAVDKLAVLESLLPDNEACDDVAEIMKPLDEAIVACRTDKTCPHCNNILYLSDLPQYEYVCPDCDENFFECEV